MKRFAAFPIILAAIFCFSILSLRAADEPTNDAAPGAVSAAWMIRGADMLDADSLSVLDSAPRLTQLAVESIEEGRRARIAGMLGKKDIELTLDIKEQPDGTALMTAQIAAKTADGQKALGEAAPVLVDAMEKALRNVVANRYAAILKSLKSRGDAAHEGLEQARAAVIKKRAQLMQTYNITEAAPVIDPSLDALQRDLLNLQLRAAAASTEMKILRASIEGAAVRPGANPPARFDPATATAEELKKHLEESRAEAAKTAAEIKGLEEEISHMEKQIADMIAKSGPDDKTVQALRDSLELKKKQLQDAQDRLVKLQKEIRDIEQGDLDPAAAKKRIEEINNEIMKLTDQKGKYEQQVAVLNSQIEKVSPEAGENDPVIAELRKSVEATQAAADDCAKQIGALKGELATLTERLNNKAGGKPANPGDARVPAPAEPYLGSGRAETLRRIRELELQDSVINSQLDILNKEIQKRAERAKAVVALILEIDDLRNKQSDAEFEYRRAAQRRDAVLSEYDLKKDAIIRRIR
jgi:chromosome segregation protein